MEEDLVVIGVKRVRRCREDRPLRSPKGCSSYSIGVISFRIRKQQTILYITPYLLALLILISQQASTI